MWCLAHRQELALKDALKGTVFDLVDDMLTHLYYVYQKSPKKCCELEEVVADLRQCVEFNDAGVRPLRASGSKWVSSILCVQVALQTKCYGNMCLPSLGHIQTTSLLYLWILLSRL